MGIRPQRFKLVGSFAWPGSALQHKLVVPSIPRVYERNQSARASCRDFSTMGKVKRTKVPLRSPNSPPAQHFTVLQWNVLADGLAQNGDFVKVDPKVLEWEFRVPLVMQEIKESEADVICLQEVNHYDQLSSLLEQHGYSGLFLPKHCSPAERYNCPPDGLAIFYRRCRFVPVGDAKALRFYGEDGQKQSQGFLQVCLQDIIVGRELCVVTTHLKAKEGIENDHVRLNQTHQMLDMLYPTGAGPECTTNGNGNGAVEHAQQPVIICGDFNTTPDSSACQALQRHPLAFKSLWDEKREGANGCQEFTTWKYRSKGESKRTIDYIWFSGDGCVSPVNRWRMLTEAEIGPNALPSCEYASDHVSVCCEFEWSAPKNK